MRVSGVAVILAAGAQAALAQGPSEDHVADLLDRAAALVAHAAQTGSASRRVVDLGVDDAVRRALENNLDIAVERLNPQVADLEVAEAMAAYRPTLSSTVGSSSRAQASSTQLDGGQRVVVDNTTFDTGLTQAVPWGGGDVTLSWNNTRAETTSVFSSFNPSHRSTMDMVYTQPLLRGFKTDNVRQRLQVTRINRDLSDIDLRRTITNTEANVRSAYWDLVYAIDAIAVQRQFLELAEQLIEDNQARVELGTLAPIDIVQSQSEAAQRRQTLTETEQNRLTAELALKRLLVGGTNDGLWEATINVTDRPTFDPRPVDVEGAIRTALAQRTDIARSQRQLDINDINLRAARDTTLPALDVRASYTLQGIGGTQFLRSGLGGDVSTIIPGGFGDALGQLAGFDFPAWNVAMTLSYPIGQSSADAAYARAQLQVRQTQAELRQLELQVATDVTSAGLQIESALRRRDAAVAARELAQQQLDAEQSKFEVGMSTNFFVVQAQRDLAAARNTELQAVLDYQKALIEFDRAQQTSLAQGSITIVSGGGG